MQKEKTLMPIQLPEERIHNFDEVALGYTFELALQEANRCLNCPNKPCIKGCPVNIDIPSFICSLKKGNIDEAYETILKSSSLPAICGRVCPQEKQCESKCTLGIKFEPVAIGRLERFVADNHKNDYTKSNSISSTIKKKVAVIGSGPSGLACAYDLAKENYDVTIFEALHEAGGVLVYGIPEFRLPKSIVKKEIEGLKKLGVKIETNVVIGKTLTIDDLKEMGFEAFFIGTGAGLPNFMNIPGETFNGVYSANEFLTRSNLLKSYLKDSITPIRSDGVVAVIGGGNVAMDAARTAKRLGAKEVYIIYRRSKDELPARKEEVEHAIEEGIIFKFLSTPIKILGDDNFSVNSLELINMELGEPDEKGRRRPIPIPNSNHILNVDTVVMAVGTSPNPIIKDCIKDLEVNRHGCLIVDENNLTSVEGVYAGGDIVSGAATVISAMGMGKIAARSIHEYLKNK